MKFTADSHVHFALPEKELGEAEIRARLDEYKNAGITFLRDGGDKSGIGATVKGLAKEYGIDYRTPVYALYKDGHYGSFLGKSFKDIDEYKKLVDEVVSLGADFIKIIVSGIMDFDEYGVLVDGKEKYQVIDVEKIKISDCDEHDHDDCDEHHHEADEGHSYTACLYKKDETSLTADELNEMVSYAHSKGLSVMAHCNGAANIKQAVKTGVDSLEHGYFMDEECASLLAESDTVWIPTIAPVAALIGNKEFNQETIKKILGNQVNMINRVWYLGGMIGLGTDAGSVDTPHVTSIESEYNFLKAAINDQEFDSHLSMSLEQIKWKFSKKEL